MLEVTEEVGMLQVMDQDRRHGVVVHLQGLKLLSKDSGLRVEVVVMLLVEVCYNFRLFENINAHYQQIKYIYTGVGGGAQSGTGATATQQDYS